MPIIEQGDVIELKTGLVSVHINPQRADWGGRVLTGIVDSSEPGSAVSRRLFDRVAAGIGGIGFVAGDIGPQGPSGEVIESIVGPQGRRGPRGPNGHHGRDGEEGPSGKHGCRGFQGFQGGIGPPGERGPQGHGPQGELGPPGPQGPRGWHGHEGERGFPGSRGFQGFQGEVGERGFQGQDGQSIVGPQGSGLQGTRGEPGPQGGVGGIGPQGNDGQEGKRGPVGPQGVGIQGPQGALAIIDVSGVANDVKLDDENSHNIVSGDTVDLIWNTTPGGEFTLAVKGEVSAVDVTVASNSQIAVAFPLPASIVTNYSNAKKIACGNIMQTSGGFPRNFGVLTNVNVTNVASVNLVTLSFAMQQVLPTGENVSVPYSVQAMLTMFA